MASIMSYSKKESARDSVFWLKNQSGDVIGFNAGGNYCSEHERGIQPLLQGIGGALTSIEGEEMQHRLLSNLEHIKVAVSKDKAMLLMTSNPIEDYQIKPALKAAHPYESGISCQWGPEYMALYSHDKANTQILSDFGMALIEGKVACVLPKEVKSSFPEAEKGMHLITSGSFCFVDTTKFDNAIKQDIKNYQQHLTSLSSQLGGSEPVKHVSNESPKKGFFSSLLKK